MVSLVHLKSTFFRTGLPSYENVYDSESESEPEDEEDVDSNGPSPLLSWFLHTFEHLISRGTLQE